MTEKNLPAIYLDASFTGSKASEIVPIVQDPYPDETNVPVDTLIKIDIADIDPGAWMRTVTKVWINDVLALDRGGTPPYFKTGFNGPGSGIFLVPSYTSVKIDIHRITIDPTFLFDSEQEVRVRVWAQSYLGHTMDMEYKFICADIVDPEISDVVAVSPTRVEVSFNEPMQMDTLDGGALNPDNYTLTGVTTPYYLPSFFTVEQIANYKVALVFPQELSHGQSYKLAVSGVKDTSGNTVVSSETTFTAANLLEPDRDFDLWSKIPLQHQRWDTSLTGSSPGDTEKLLQCFQDLVDLAWYDSDLLKRMYDIDLAPMDSINLLLEQLGNPFKFDLTDLQKRKLLQNLIYIYRQKGTEAGIINAIFFFMGITVTITVPLTRSWRLGYDKLGYTTYLGPSDSAARFTFWVNCPIALTTDERKQMNDIIKLMKVAHEHHVIKEPTPPPPATWRLGYHKLGIETRLGG